MLRGFVVRRRGSVMGTGIQLLLVGALAAGVVVAWIRSRDGEEAKAPRGRLRQLGWTLALALITVSLLATLSRTFEPYGLRASMVVVALAVAAVLVVRPGLAPRLVPAGLILLGVAGLVLARTYTFAGPAPALPVRVAVASGPKGGNLQPGPDGFVPAGDLGTGQYLALVQSYLFVLLGGWLAWRSPDPVLTRARHLLGRVNGQPARAQFRALLLLPVAVMAAELFIPGTWYSADVVVPWFLLFLCAAFVVLRRWPGGAARLAVLGVLFLGLVGIVLAATFQYGHVPSAYGIVVLADRSSPGLVVGEAIILLAFGAWLVPQTFPSARRLLRLPLDPALARQVQQLTESRAVVVDTAASDLRRLERDLHDGAQARLVALGMSLRAAERLIPVNPAAALALVAEARDTSARALTELRELVRGVHPPVLADRGLEDAVRALALDCPLAVQTQIDLPGRVPAPVETACYFAVAELLTNAAKHSGARDARVDVRHANGRLRIEVTDFGLGGADPAAGSGLAGVEKRLAAFDGIMAISSPAGGPTIMVLEVPCALSSPKTSTC
jgi:signal transduction histidine kinase